jgi:hypothetical protein
MGRKGLGLLLAGLAAYGYYKYSKMNSQEKSDLKNKAKKFMDDNLGNLGNVFGKKAKTQNAYSQD